LLRESHREGKKVRKRTLANLSALSDEQIEAIRAVLAGVNLQPAPLVLLCFGSPQLVSAETLAAGSADIAGPICFGTLSVSHVCASWLGR
jgi:hypothetical protein